MNAEFKTSPTETEPTEQILVRGEIIGEITKGTLYSGGTSYHACLYVTSFGIRELIQGHGESKTAAIQSAIIKGRIHCEELFLSITHLEKKLGLRS